MKVRNKKSKVGRKRKGRIEEMSEGEEGTSGKEGGNVRGSRIKTG